MRLAGAKVPNRGRIEVLVNGRWGTICDDGFDNKAANIVCRTLGYKSGVAAPVSSYGLGEWRQALVPGHWSRLVPLDSPFVKFLRSDNFSFSTRKRLLADLK